MSRPWTRLSPSLPRAIASNLAVKLAIAVSMVILVCALMARSFMATSHMTAMAESMFQQQLFLCGLHASGIGEILSHAALSGNIPKETLLRFGLDASAEENAGPEKNGTLRYDKFLRKSLGGLLDQAIQMPYVYYAAVSDAHGFIPHVAYNADLHTDSPRPIAGKTVMTDTISQKAAKTREPLYMQTISGPAGEIIDISVPILVDGQHWGALRTGIIREDINRHVSRIINTGNGWFWFFTAGAIAAVSGIVTWLTFPVRRLEILVSQIADGRISQRMANFSSDDEIGEIARHIERLRYSIFVALGRLNRNR